MKNQMPNEMPEWLEKQFDNAEKTVAEWSDAKCEAAGIPRADVVPIDSSNKSGHPMKVLPEDLWDPSTWLVGNKSEIEKEFKEAHEEKNKDDIIAELNEQIVSMQKEIDDLDATARILSCISREYDHYKYVPGKILDRMSAWIEVFKAKQIKDFISNESFVFSHELQLFISESYPQFKIAVDEVVEIFGKEKLKEICAVQKSYEEDLDVEELFGSFSSVLDEEKFLEGLEGKSYIEDYLKDIVEGKIPSKSSGIMGSQEKNNG